MRRKFALALVLGVLGAPAVVAQPIAGEVLAETERLNDWLDLRFEEALDFSPIQKTQIGRKDDYDRIDDMSEAAADARFEWQRDTVDELERSFDYELLTPEAQVSYDLWIYQFERAEAARPFRRRAYLFNQMRGQHTSLPQFLVTSHAVDDVRDMVAYVSRIRGVGRAIGQVLGRAMLASEEGVHAPKFAYDSVIEQSRALITGAPFDDGPPSALWADANSRIDALVERGLLDTERASELRRAARTALVEQLQPAYNALIAWAETELPLADPVATGIWRLPDGEAYYENQLAAVTTTTLSADEIHAIGLAEVARIHEAMLAIKDEVEFEGSLAEFFAFVSSDSRFYFPSTDEGRQAYLDAATNHIEAIERRLPEFFGLLPEADLEVRRVEAFRERAGQAQHYQRGAPDGSRPGIYYAHLIDMSAMPIPQLESVAYHEGLPGHHMQLSIAQELTGLPTFRTLAGFTAYSEGWGLYAEALALEMGGYEDPYSNFGRLSGELWRAIRLVVDTGLHAKGWTEQEAFEYALDNSPETEGSVRPEIQRYIVMPGQATAYKIGMMRIQELRARAETALGAAFDIRGFHDTVLGGGALPLTMLEARVDHWIQSF
ncbi:MAG: DUF885 domain-containing protein [Gammaproteobacteria bacterium]|jgi:uncharacterized protein (DUF885 family)